MLSSRQWATSSLALAVASPDHETHLVRSDHRIAIRIAGIPGKSTRLGIEHILGYSPQARGRSERANRALQERLRVLVRRHLNGQTSV